MRVSNIALAVGILAAALAVPMMIEATTGHDLGVTGDASALVTYCHGSYRTVTNEDGSTETTCSGKYLEV